MTVPNSWKAQRETALKAHKHVSPYPHTISGDAVLLIDVLGAIVLAINELTEAVQHFTGPPSALVDLNHPVPGSQQEIEGGKT